MDDAHDSELSIFGLNDLWQALNDVVGLCWLRERHNGKGYPGRQAAWAGFVKGSGLGMEVLGSLRWAIGNRTTRVLDLREHGVESSGGRGTFEAALAA